MALSITVVMGLMKKGNIVPGAGIEPTPLAFQAGVLALHHIVSLMSPLFPWLPVCLCSSLPQRSVQNTTLILLEL